MNKREDKKKFRRCVKKVNMDGLIYNPYAVCKVSLGLSKKKKKKSNK